MNDNAIPNLRAVKNEADAAAVRAAPAVADEAALAGKPAGQYELTATAELVAWNGAAVTARGPMPASRAALDETRSAPAYIPADVLGIRRGQTVRDSLSAALNTNGHAVELPGGTYRLTGDALPIAARPLRGLRPGDTVIQADMNANQPAIILVPDPQPNGYTIPAETLLQDVEVVGSAGSNGLPWPAPDDAAHAIGVQHQGSHTRSKNVKLRGFGVGYLLGGANTYINTIENLHVYYSRIGLVLNNNVANSGENTLVRDGCLHNNFTNVEVRSNAWFTTIENMSLDYPIERQFWVNAKLFSFRVRDGHLEWLRERWNDPGNHAAGTHPVWLVDGPAGQDVGLMVFEAVDLVLFSSEVGVDPNDLNTNANRKRFAERTIDELVSPSIGAATLVFRDCVDAVYGETINRVLTRGRPLPGAETVAGQEWVNNETLVPIEVRLKMKIDAGTAGLRAYEVFVSDRAGGAERGVRMHSLPDGVPGGMTVDAVFVVQPHERYRVARAGATVTAVTYELLPR